VPPLLRDIVQLPWSKFAPLALLVLGSLLTLMPIAYVDGDLPSSANRRWSQRRFLALSLVPLVAACASLAAAWGVYSPGENGVPPLWAFVVYGIVIHFAGWLIGRALFFKKRPARDNGRRAPTFWEFGAVAVVGAIGGWALWMLVPPTVDGSNVN